MENNVMSKQLQKLELTWIGKEKRPRLEPRVLVENPELSHHAAERRRDGKDIFDKNDYVVQWYYNTVLGNYYKTETNAKGEVIGINYMSEEEFEDFDDEDEE